MLVLVCVNRRGAEVCTTTARTVYSRCLAAAPSHLAILVNLCVEVEANELSVLCKTSKFAEEKLELCIADRTALVDVNSDG